MSPVKSISFAVDTFRLSLTLLCCLLVMPAFALSPPPIVLTGLTQENYPVEIELTREEIASFQQETIITTLPWINGSASFSGVNLQSLLTHYQLKPGTIHLSALNQYSAELTWQDMEKYQPLLAIRRDNEWMQVRDYGPFWLIFSLDTYPELADNGFQDKMVWQLNKISVVP
ncbi:oxidoreductase [Photobacterium galatheae]|uniref:oxidoreductase n=1 Tax=Photobacterium galatheae TaxID=1654360 RepID=UPI00202CC49F|nr:oxidoreductase [Photobacterium galatheae]MCM0147284.1 oxidoreductase [Photobacterium galatheae]